MTLNWRLIIKIAGFFWLWYYMPAYAQLRDPTTYAPAVVYYIAAQQDWKTSQVFFEHGWIEKNPDYTISGRPYDTPVSYARGMVTTRWFTGLVLAQSVGNNVGARVVEHCLTKKFPTHKKLIRVASWAERIAFASYLGYMSSHQHFEQTALNRRLAKGL